MVQLGKGSLLIIGLRTGWKRRIDVVTQGEVVSIFFS